MASSKRSKKQREELVGQSDPRAALDSAALLAAAKPLLQRLEEDLVGRAKASPAVTAALTARYEAEKAANRTAESFAGWTAALATQVAAAWLLSCVFVRTLEDRGLLKQTRLAGPGAEDSQRQFFHLAPSLTERDYLLTVFHELAHHPAAKDLFDAEHSLVWKLSPSAEVAKELLALFRVPSASEPAFRFGQASTRFLGDIYQDLSEDVRKRYALLQTPDFIETYILDRTLEPAITRFGLDDTTLIDPTCGSGHFLLGAFDRLFEKRLRAEPGIDPRVAAVNALNGVYGADINPFAVAIARFRLTLAFLAKAGYAKLAEAPALPLHLVVADSLRINPQHPQQELWQHANAGAAGLWIGDVFAFDDERAAIDVLGRQYAAVVANPPYITVKDAALRETYRQMYPRSCFREYSLAAPFCERIFQLARPRGYAGQITSNSFMKREFGCRLIEEFLPTVNLELVVNTSGAYIPGHGTPTVLLFGTHEAAQAADLPAVLAKRGEPSTPEDPSLGLVWRSIVEHGGDVGFENDYISVSRIGRDVLARHPWSLGGGGAAELKQLLEDRSASTLEDLIDCVGFSVITGEDNCLVASEAAFARSPLSRTHVRRLVVGEEIRDWGVSIGDFTVWPNLSSGERLGEADIPDVLRFLWPYRTILKARRAFGVPVEEKGIPWWALREVYAARMKTPLTIAFAFVATHNHFVLDRGGKVFKQSAPIIKLPEGATEDDHLALLAYLNSSTACFWMKQVFFPKYGAIKADHPDPARNFYEFAGTGLKLLPVPELGALRQRLIFMGALLVKCSQQRSELLRFALTWPEASSDPQGDLRKNMSSRWTEADSLRRRMVFLQEEIDWTVYQGFGLVTDELGGDEHSGRELTRGQRAFETEPSRLSLVRRGGALMAASEAEVETSAPTVLTSLQEGLIEKRKKAVIDSPELALIESTVFKRMWRDTEQNEPELEYRERVAREAIQTSFLDLVEARVSREIEVQPLKGLTTGIVGLDKDLTDSIGAVSVPFVSVLMFSEAGLEKRAEWERCWTIQRAEDEGAVVQTIAPPRKYDAVDYLAGQYWQLRGKLDVPKERFISYPHCESDQDGELVCGWAGWDHLQRTEALAALYLKRKDNEGWTAERLTPMLAGLLELIPSVKQWHNEPSAKFDGLRMGGYYEQFLDGECRQYGLTHDDLRAWRPPKKTRGKPKAAKPKSPIDAAIDGDDAAGDPPAAKRPRAKRKPKATAGEPPPPPKAE